MKYIQTAINGPVILEPRVFNDPRGYFMESFRENDFEQHFPGVHFVQENESRSVRGVVRGLHFQRPPFTQAKLVRVVVGSVLDVAVDIRSGSPTFGQHVAVVLTADNHRMFFVPRGFAHGFSVLSEEAVFQYKCDNYYAPEADAGISLADPALNIDWQIRPEERILSEKDMHHPLLSELESPFTMGEAEE